MILNDLIDNHVDKMFQFFSSLPSSLVLLMLLASCNFRNFFLFSVLNIFQKVSKQLHDSANFQSCVASLMRALPIFFIFLTLSCPFSSITQIISCCYFCGEREN